MAYAQKRQEVKKGVDKFCGGGMDGLPPHVPRATGMSTSMIKLIESWVILQFGPEFILWY